MRTLATLLCFVALSSAHAHGMPQIPEGLPPMKGLPAGSSCDNLSPTELSPDITQILTHCFTQPTGVVCMGFPNNVMMSKTCGEAQALQTNPDALQALREEAEALMAPVTEEHGHDHGNGNEFFTAMGIAATETCDGMAESDLKPMFNAFKFCGMVPNGKICVSLGGQVVERSCELKGLGVPHGHTCEGKTPNDYVQLFKPKDYCMEHMDGVLCLENFDGELMPKPCPMFRMMAAMMAGRRPPMPEIKATGVSQGTCENTTPEDLEENYAVDEFCGAHSDGVICSLAGRRRPSHGSDGSHGSQEPPPPPALRETPCAKALQKFNKIKNRLAKMAKKAAKKIMQEAEGKPEKFYFTRDDDETCKGRLEAAADNEAPIELLPTSQVLDFCSGSDDREAFLCPVSRRLLMGEADSDVENLLDNVMRLLEEGKQIRTRENRRRARCENMDETTTEV